MKTITLQILAEDIRTTKYTNSDDCAITRALKQAGINAEEVGGDIYHNDRSLKNRRIDTPKQLANQVRRMYAHLDTKWDKVLYPDWYGEECQALGTLEPKDFTFELEIPDSW